jgi:hypothetical protein
MPVFAPESMRPFRLIIEAFSRDFSADGSGATFAVAAYLVNCGPPDEP